jgi:hypothetical protein
MIPTINHSTSIAAIAVLENLAAARATGSGKAKRTGVPR